MNPKAENIAGLLHECRGSWTSDTVSALVDTIREASPLECQLALAEFSKGMLKAAESAVLHMLMSAKADAAEGEEREMLQ